VSGLILPDSTPGRVLQAVRDGRVDAVMSWELAAEILEVVQRPRLRRYGLVQHDAEELLEVMRPWLPAVDVAVPLRDPADAPVVSAALAGNAPVIVSGDGDLLDDRALRDWLEERGIEVIASAELLTRLGID